MGVLLLERVLPGTSLKTYFPTNDQEAMLIICNIIKKLHQAPYPKNNNFPIFSDWLIKLDKDYNIPTHYLIKARKLKDKLLKSSKKFVLLHGDLHHDNILKSSESWHIIDPKGILGEPAYEVGAFIRNPIPKLLSLDDEIINVINNRINFSAKFLDLEISRIKEWCFVQIVLAWIWALEDNLDTNYFFHPTKVFDIINT